MKKLNPDIIVVVAYGKILPKEILDLPKFGCVNSHASLLPKYRGSAPIQWCIVCGETQTGITIQFMDEGIDTGDIIEMVTVDINDTDNADTLYDKLSVAAASLMCRTLEKIENGTAVRTKQDNAAATYAPIIKKEMALIDFIKSAIDIHNLVRGFYSWPTAYFMFEGKRLKVFETELAGNTDKAPGTVIKSDTEFIIACGNFTAIKLKEIQLEGSKRMKTREWLMGKKISEGTVIA